MIEKHADNEVRVWKKNDAIMMRLQGSDEDKSYDGRFGDLSGLKENEEKFFPVEID